MSKLTIAREKQTAKIEERWLLGELDGQAVDVHLFVYRAYGEVPARQFGASAHLHKPGGGRIMTSSGAPDRTKICWAANVEDAVKAGLDVLESRDDLKVS